MSKGKKKVELLKIPAICLAFLKKYLIGVVFLKLCLLEAGARRRVLRAENTVTFMFSFF